MSLNHLHPHFDPIAAPVAVVSAGDVCVTVLTSRLLRLEYNPTGACEDRPSQAFWFHRQPVPICALCREDGRMIISSGLASTWRMHR